MVLGFLHPIVVGRVDTNSILVNRNLIPRGGGMKSVER